MAHQTKERSAIWHALKAHGWEPPRKFVQMSHADLVAARAEWEQANGIPLEVVVPEEAPDPAPAYEPERAADWNIPVFEYPETQAAREIPRSNFADPNEMPGQRTNSKPLEEPIRIDDEGRAWLQEEVRKPAYPKPRGRRVLRYQEKGTVTETVQVGEYTETFEIEGSGPGTPAEIKITLPSYQVGIYRDERFPFKVICYSGSEGFDRHDVEEFYGAPELVPPSCRRIYVSNVLCYDMRSVITAINDEYRHRQLTGKGPQG